MTIHLSSPDVLHISASEKKNCNALLYLSPLSGKNCEVFEILISRENFVIEYPRKTALHC